MACGGDYYFHSVLVMVFLVNIISLCAFFIPLDDTSGRLGHLRTWVEFSGIFSLYGV